MSKARSTPAATDTRIRPLASADLEAVVALDTKESGHSRRGFIEKRLEALANRPADFIALAVDNAGGLAGFAIARLMTGEFGTAAPVAALDLLGIDPAYRHKGLGGALLAAVEDEAKARGANEIATEAEWTNTALLGFFAASGFAVAPRLVVERDVSPNAV